MARTIILPRVLDTKLDRLTELVEEVNGVLLFRSRGETCPLETLFVTGVGSGDDSEGHVQSTQQGLDVINTFFREFPDYKFIKFHTHSKGTIERYGDYYARHFSSGDIEVYREQLRENRNFLALLATPETRLLMGIDNPTLSYATFEGQAECNRLVDEALERISERLGYDPRKTFSARRR